MGCFFFVRSVCFDIERGAIDEFLLWWFDSIVFVMGFLGFFSNGVFVIGGVGEWFSIIFVSGFLFFER